MAGVTLGYLRYVLGLDTLAFTKGMSDADRQLVLLQKKFAARGKEFTKVGKELSLAVTAPLAGFAAFGVKKALELNQAMAQVNAALKSTGGAAGVTAGQLKKAAEAFESKSLFESEDILKSVSARLLAFGNIHGATFNRAQQDIIDYAQRSGKDLGAATIIIGKALEAPAKFFGALARAGIVLSASQQALVKDLVATGQTAAAQDIVLSALETKYRGAADAAANADPFRKTTVAFKQMAETIGTALLPLIPPLTKAITTMIGWFEKLSPSTQKWLIVAGGTAAILGPMLIVLGGLTKVIAGIGPLVTGLSTVFKVLSASEALATVASTALDVALSPIVLTVGAVVLALGAAYEAWKHWDEIVPVIKRVYEAVKTFIVDKVFPVLKYFAPLFGPIGLAALALYEAFKHWDEISAIAQRVYNAVKTWLADKLTAILNALEHPIAAVTGWFHTMYDKVVGHSYVPDMVKGIADEFAQLQKVMVDPTISATDKVVAAFQSLARIGGQIFGQKAGGLFSAIADAVGAVVGAVNSFHTPIPQLQASNPSGANYIAPFSATPRALGGPVVPGRMYRVGENGPEYVSFGSAGYVHPNKASNDGGLRIQVVKGDLFDVIVDRRASNVAAPLAGRAAMMGASGGYAAVRRKAERTFP